THRAACRRARRRAAAGHDARRRHRGRTRPGRRRRDRRCRRRDVGRGRRGLMPREEVDGTGRAGVARTLLATAAAWGGTHVARRALDRWTGDARWTRVNHRGEPVSLLAGPAVAAGLAGAGLAARAAGAGPVATAGLV